MGLEERGVVCFPVKSRSPFMCYSQGHHLCLVALVFILKRVTVVSQYENSGIIFRFQCGLCVTSSNEDWLNTVLPFGEIHVHEEQLFRGSWAVTCIRAWHKSSCYSQEILLMESCFSWADSSHLFIFKEKGGKLHIVMIFLNFKIWRENTAIVSQLLHFPQVLE